MNADLLGSPEPPSSSPSVSESLPALSEEELVALSRLGQRWRAASSGPSAPLPVDPSLQRSGETPAVSRFGRFAPIAMFRVEGPRELVASEATQSDRSMPARAAHRLRRALLGPSLASSAVVHERMRKLIALPVLSGDLLSSVAYGPEAMITVLVLAGSKGLALELPLAFGLLTLMVVVGVSYRQTIRAYPSGAGSYIVATDNLGEVLGLAAATGLIIDYILTVSVSVTAGVASVTSAIPSLRPDAVALGVLVIAILVAGNLRGVRQAGNLFALPTYLFLVAMAVLIVGGFSEVASRGFTAVPPPHLTVLSVLTPLLVLRAFASGATSMTGIEAVSNAVPVFRPVQWRNARATLTCMVGILIVLFVGLVALIHLQGLVPTGNQTLLSELAAGVFGRGVLYGFIQAATALELMFAADTAFNDLPRVLFFMARNDHAPRSFLRMGDRLAFSNGIILLGLASTLILVAFHGQTESLIPLFAVGVFLAFTLSQAGMVAHWRRLRTAHWRKSMVVNGVGAVASGLVLVTAAVTKFVGGAWVVVAAVPLVTVLLLRIKAHYVSVERETGLSQDLTQDLELVPSSARTSLPPDVVTYPGGVHHLLVVPMARIDRPSLRALSYAVSFGQPTLALHVSPEEIEAERFQEAWDRWGAHVPLEVVVSPYRAVVGPIVNYIEALHSQRSDLTLTVVVPEIRVRRLWHRLLHDRLGHRLRRGLERHAGIAVADVPFHLTR
ncbi:MAG: APC family permease [Acidimicrobiales bacterium]